MTSKDLLVYQTSPVVNFGTNVFEQVPVILQVDATPLVSVVRTQDLTYTSEISIYHSDGVHLGKVRGTRFFPSTKVADGGVQLRSTHNATICTRGGVTCFEIHHQPGDSFRLNAELWTPSGLFVKSTDSVPEVLTPTGAPLTIAGCTLKNNRIIGCRIGIHIRSNGDFSIGVS